MKAVKSSMPALPFFQKAALWYALHGWHVFPLAPDSKLPWKGSHAFLEATTDRAQIISWWQHEPRSNIGIACGPSDLAVLDVDPRHGGEQSFESLRAELGADAFETVHQITPSGGTHYIFSGKIASGANVFGDGMSGLDTRGEGGYIVAAPSIVDGRSYAWEEGYRPNECQLLPWPARLREKTEPRVALDVSTLERIPFHSRDHTLTRIAGMLRYKGFTVSEIEATLQQVNADRSKPPLSRSQVSKIAYSIGLRTTSGSIILKADNCADMCFTPLADLMAEPSENVAFVCEDLLPAGGTSILAARPKVGKSSTARTLALCVAQGESFLGRRCIQGSVVWLALEEKRGELARQFRELGCTDEAIAFFCGRAPAKLIEQLREYVQSKKPALVVLDPLIRAARARDLNDYSEVSAILEPLTFIARETGAHLMFLHHTSKSGNEPLGSTALLGSVDTLLSLKKGADGQRTLTSTLRYGVDLEETVLQREASGFISEVGTRREVDERNARALILSFLESRDERVDEDCIRKNVEVRRSTFVEALRGLVRDKVVERCGAGHRGNPYLYALPGKMLVPTVPACIPEPEKPNPETGETPHNREAFSCSRDSTDSQTRGNENPAESITIGEADQVLIVDEHFAYANARVQAGGGSSPLAHEELDI